MSPPQEEDRLPENRSGQRQAPPDDPYAPHQNYQSRRPDRLKTEADRQRPSQDYVAARADVWSSACHLSNRTVNLLPSLVCKTM